MSDDFESALAALPEPVSPATLARTVMARVSRLAEERPRTAVTSIPVDIPREGLRWRWTDLVAWAAAIGGLAIVFVAWVGGGLGPGSWLDLAWSQFGAPPSTVPSGADETAIAAFALGLLLYAAALFAPLRDGQQP